MRNIDPNGNYMTDPAGYWYDLVTYGCNPSYNKEEMEASYYEMQQKLYGSKGE